MYLKQQGALDINERSMYLGGRIQAYPSYSVRTDRFRLQIIANQSKQEVLEEPNINTELERIFNRAKSQTHNADKVTFDANASILVFGDKTCDIPDESLEYYVCKLTFKNRRVAAKEDDILEKSVKNQDSQRAVYDAMLRVNKKAREELGIEKLFNYKAAKIRIAKNYI